jgi:hypothetical protein
MTGRYLVLRFPLSSDESPIERRRTTAAIEELRMSLSGAGRAVLSHRELIILVTGVINAEAENRMGEHIAATLRKHGIDASKGSAMTIPEMDPDTAIYSLTAGFDLRLFLDPGDAPPAVVARVLEALSNLHRAAGGTGLAFRADGELSIHVAAGVR